MTQILGWCDYSHRTRYLGVQSQVGLRKHHYKQSYGGDGIPVELFQILKDDAVKVLHSICQQIWKTQQWPQDWKRSVSILIPKKGNAKECSNYHTIALISHASKVMLKILQARLQRCLNQELRDIQVGFRKGRETRDQIANICWIIEKAREFKRTLTSASLTMPKLLVLWITTNCGKFWKRWKYQTTYLSPAISVCRSRSNIRTQHGTMDCFKIEKGVCQGYIYCHPAYLTYMQSTSREMPDWMKHKLDSRWLGEISTTSDMQMTAPYGRKWRIPKEPLDEGERGEWKSWLNWSHHFIANRWGNNGNSERFYFLELQNHCRWWLQPWN